MKARIPKLLRPRGADVDAWPLVRYLRALILDPATPDVVMTVDQVLAANGPWPPRVRERIREGLARHLAAEDRAAAALHLALAIPARPRRRVWFTVSTMTALALIVLAVTRSAPAALGAWGWMAIASTVVGAVVRRGERSVVAACAELERIRLLCLHGDATAALAVWRRLEVHAQGRRRIVDVVIDAGCALAELPIGALTSAQRAEVAARLEELRLRATADCADDARAAIDRLAAGEPWGPPG